MRIAIITVTRKGALLANRITREMPEDFVIYSKTGCRFSETAVEFTALGELMRSIFNEFQAFIFIMAAGIVVRVIAPYIKDKRIDPAVVVIDDAGKHAISLLSGHIGGANELTRRISRVIGANPVVTTATDVADKVAADTLAGKLGLVIEPFSSLKTVNAAIANGDGVAFLIDTALAEGPRYIQAARELGVSLLPVDSDTVQEAVAVVISARSLPLKVPHIYLRPPKLAVGIGCRRNTPAQMIMQAIQTACSQIGKTIEHIAVVGTSVVKSDEEGLLTVVNDLHVPIYFYTNEQLQRCILKYNLQNSAFVNNTIGVGNVCEAAAILAGRNNNLLLGKTKFQKVTVAIAPASYLSLELGQEV